MKYELWNQRHEERIEQAEENVSNSSQADLEKLAKYSRLNNFKEITYLTIGLFGGSVAETIIARRKLNRKDYSEKNKSFFDGLKKLNLISEEII